MAAIPRTIAVAYLARGADDDCDEAFRRFLASYQKYAAGHPHQLYVIYKGFSSQAALEAAMGLFAPVAALAIETSDEGFDIGAYLVAAREIPEDFICFFNTNAEILAGAWLQKLSVNLIDREVGMVGATGSFESLSGLDPRIGVFPNVHLRSNAFMINRRLLLELCAGVKIADKLDAYFFESGPASLTNKVWGKGLDVRIVGRNGRGYSPRWWPASETFRRLTQDNLLVADNQTRHYMAAVWSVKHTMVLNTWGPFVDPSVALKI